MPARRGEWLALVGFVAVTFAAAGLGSLFTETGATSWYAALEKPAWRPPDWLFGPMWTLLYVLMAVAAWLVWHRRGFAGGARPLGLYALQLLLNAAWTPVFFGLQAPGPAFALIVVLWLAITATLVAFLRVVRLAGWLLVPYLAWVTFAAALNFSIWRLNE